MEGLRDQAKKLKDEQKYSEANEIYEKIWSRENKDKWLGWEYAYCLKKTEDIAKAIAVCKNTYGLDTKFIMNNDLMAWCVYERYFKHKKESYTEHEINNLEIVGQAIIKLIEHKRGSAFECIVFAIVNIYRSKMDKSSHQKIIDWLGMMNVDMLSNEMISYQDKKGKHIELQSRREEYYSIKSKSLMILENYAECIKCCEEAEKNVDKFHYNNDIWLSGRKYYSYGKLGESDIAIKGLKGLLNKKSHWSLLFKISQIYDCDSQQELALHYAYKALLTKDPDKMKIKVISFVAEKLDELGNNQLADLHYCYYRKIRVENEWKIPPKIEERLSRIDAAKENISSSKIRSIWLKNIKKDSNIYEGRISKILPHGKSGFINYEKGSIFFRINEVIGGRRVREKGQVSFIIEDSYDVSKGKKTIEAKYVEVI